MEQDESIYVKQNLFLLIQFTFIGMIQKHDTSVSFSDFSFISCRTKLLKRTKRENIRSIPFWKGRQEQCEKLPVGY